MKMKNETTLNDFVKVVQFKVITSIKNHWKSLDNFTLDYNYQTSHKDKKANLIFSRIVCSFNIEHSKLVNIAGRDSKGSKKLGLFLKQLTRDNPELVYVHKKTATYKSTGKKFNSKSWFYIPFETLKKLFSGDGIEGCDAFDIKSEHYNDTQRKLIKKWIYGNREPRTYNKTGKFKQYQDKRNIARTIDDIRNGLQVSEEALGKVINDLDI